MKRLALLTAALMLSGFVVGCKTQCGHQNSCDPCGYGYREPGLLDGLFNSHGSHHRCCSPNPCCPPQGGCYQPCGHQAHCGGCSAHHGGGCSHAASSGCDCGAGVSSGCGCGGHHASTGSTEYPIYAGEYTPGEYSTGTYDSNGSVMLPPTSEPCATCGKQHSNDATPGVVVPNGEVPMPAPPAEEDSPMPTPAPTNPDSASTVPSSGFWIPALPQHRQASAIGTDTRPVQAAF